jgi:TIR domain
MPSQLSLFLSHSSADKTKLSDLVSYLRKAEISLWFDDQIPPGAAIPKWMSEGLAKADRFLLAWSSYANDSPHVWNELDAFYMRKPRPGDILFLRLDATPLPALYAARRYLRWNGDVDHDALLIENWMNGENSQNVGELDSALPTEAFLKMIPKGPRVPAHWISRELVDAYAGVVNKATRAQAVVDKAVALRLAADPGDPTVTPMSLAELPSFDFVGAESFWQEALHLACLKGPRMLGALLLAQTDDVFSEKAKSERANILQHLRNPTDR